MRTLPSPQSLAPDDPRQWAILFTRSRLRKGWSYIRLAALAGLSERVTIHACLTGRCHATTALKLAHVLGITVQMPQPNKILTAHEAQFGTLDTRDVMLAARAHGLVVYERRTRKMA